jgi:hypothetical protein
VFCLILETGAPKSTCCGHWSSIGFAQTPVIDKIKINNIL